MVDYTALRNRLHGPVYPVLPAFLESGTLDIDGTQRYVDMLVRRGAQILIVTTGTSRLNLLSFDEVAALNASIVEACDGRALAIAGNPATGSTEMTIELLQAAEKDGADAFLAIYSERYYGDAPIEDFFTTLSQASSLGLLVHAIPMRLASSGPTQVQTYSLALIERLANLPTVVGMKEENGVELLRQRIVQRFEKQMTIILSGGAMRNFLANWSFGASAYLVGIGSFLPDIEERFYKHLQSGELEAARAIVFQQELPYFEVAVPIGWHTALKGTLALFDLMPPYERLPMSVPVDSEVTALRKICCQLGWLPRSVEHIP